MTAENIHAMARALGRLGGRARAQKLTAKRRRAIASAGGLAANARRTKERRRKIAREAARARWAGRDAIRLIEENARRCVVIQDLWEYVK